jgi:hypothetical protein
MNLEPFGLDSVAVETVLQIKRVIFCVLGREIFDFGWMLWINPKSNV